MHFYLGVHEPLWLAKTVVPLFVSHRRLMQRRPKRGWAPATCAWALDSGGFTEVTQHGGWKTTPEEYVRAVRQWVDEVGMPDFVAPQDWMCEPVALRATGLTILEHQRRTVENYVVLRDLAPDLPVVPALQGWAKEDYAACLELYAEAGVDLEALPRVGLGTVCRRQATDEVGEIVESLSFLRLHGFGVKKHGLLKYGRLLTSADSMAWSYRARRRKGDGEPPLCGRISCRSPQNCFSCAREWRRRLLDAMSEEEAVLGIQTRLF